MNKLTLWHNDCDWVVAADPVDATKVWTEMSGEKPEDYPDMEWEPWGEDRPLSILDEHDKKLVLTGAEWAARGRAYIGSTEY
jgi:hypothetical protein